MADPTAPPAGDPTQSADRAASKSRKGGKSLFGLPQWALVPMVVAVGAIGIIWYRNHKGAASKSSTSGASGTATSPVFGTFGLPTDESNALFAQLRDMQYQQSNMNMAPRMPGQLWTSWTTGTETLNDLAQATDTTAQAIIDQTTAAAGGHLDPAIQTYFDTGQFDSQIPYGFTLALPVFAPNNATTGDTPPPIGQGNVAIGTVDNSVGNTGG